MSIVQPEQYAVPGLATVTIDKLQGDPLLRIVLDPSYNGDLTEVDDESRYPDGVYLESTDWTFTDARLDKFMEVLMLWDHDHDGTYDGDAVARAITRAMLSTNSPQEFKRPSGGWYTNALMRLMPPPPERHIVYGFGELRDRFRWYHYLIGLPAIAAILGLIQLQVHFVPFLRYSVVSGIMVAGDAAHIGGGLTLLIVGVLYFAFRQFRKPRGGGSTLSPNTYGFFNKAAVFEEQAFREGAENWNTRQRVTSCIVFGAIHMTNLIYPLATILPLALGGAIFMTTYLRVYRKTKFRRSAVLAAALVHRVYNRLALIAFGIAIVASLGMVVIPLIGFTAAAMYAARRMSRPHRQ